MFESTTSLNKAADVEKDALVKQIQKSMSPEQIQEIASMELSAEDTNSWMKEMGGYFGRGLMGEGGDSEKSGGFAPPAGGMSPGMGGRGMRESGSIPGMDAMGGGMGAADADAQDTRMAEFEENPDAMLAQLAERMVINGWIQTLMQKTGKIDQIRPTNRTATGVLWTVISESTGIDMETLRAEMAEGASLAEIIKTHDGNQQEVEAALKETFSNMPEMEGQDLDQVVDDLLSGEMGFEPGKSQVN